MAVDRQRHGRQIRLAEVGLAGQARIDASDVTLGAQGFAREIEATYLRLAGARVHSAMEPTPAPMQLADLGLHDGPATEVAEGALRALVALRRILGVGAESDG